MNFAHVLRDARQLGGLTQAQLSTRSGVTQSVISAFERGRREPGAETFLMLIEAAGLDFIIRVPTNSHQHPTLPDSAQTRALVKPRQQILDLVAEHHASNVRIFGSVARGEARPDSDIDILVDFGPNTGLFSIVALQESLSKLLHFPIDLGDPKSLNPHVQPSVAKDQLSL
jgi:predicted nucleotidyltransferase/DNA-binding XRE family transcriptional regulator